MNAPPHNPQTRRQVSAEGGTLIRTLIGLWPYIWPSDRSDLKLRVLGAFVLLLFAKLATIATPFTFKWATDALTGQGSAPAFADDWLVWLFAAPLALTLAGRSSTCTSCRCALTSSARPAG